jgi:hypothetical protein
MIDFLLPIAKNDSQSQLSSGLSAAGDTIQLKTGEAALHPTGYKAAATSAGTSTTLNSTGIGSKAVVGDFIRNITDGSWGWVLTVSANSITTTELIGGSDDTWESSDEWVIGSTYAWISKKDASGEDTTRELVLVEYIDASSDQVHIETRGVEGVATDFLADDYFSVYTSAQFVNQSNKALGELMRRKAEDSGVVHLTGAESVAGVKTFSSFPVTPSSAPSSDYEVANKKYVDDVIVGVGFDFTDLGDTPASYSGQGGKLLKVNSGETDVEFVEEESVMETNNKALMEMTGSFDVTESGTGPSSDFDYVEFDDRTEVDDFSMFTVSLTSVATSNGAYILEWNIPYSQSGAGDGKTSIEVTGVPDSLLSGDSSVSAASGSGTLSGSCLIYGGTTIRVKLTASLTINSTSRSTTSTVSGASFTVRPLKKFI